MALGLNASDPAFCNTRNLQAQDLDELIAWTRQQLHLGSDRPWRVVSSLMKLTKKLFEVDENGRRLIGKVSESPRARDTFSRMQMLWEAGMRPPSRCIVPEPVAWLPEKCLLLQARANGRQLLEVIRDHPARAEEDVLHAAEWLRALRSLPLAGLAQAENRHPVLARCRRELADAVPELQRRFESVAQRLEQTLDYHGSLVISHGDFHPMNVYVTDEGTVTAIDLDTVACDEPAFDVAWFLAQTAVMGYHLHGTFAGTQRIREAFWQASAEPPERVDLHMRFAILRSLHYDLCILKLKEVPHVETFLEAAETGVFP